MKSGTTLAISKKGSGLADTLNSCIDAFIATKSYKDLCTKYDLEGDCFQNEFLMFLRRRSPTPSLRMSSPPLALMDIVRVPNHDMIQVFLIRRIA
jgi:hypothetical protein